MRSRRHDESGIVGVILTVVIVWALVAVVMLTRTLQAAEQIDTRVTDITASVNGINGHLNTGCNTAQPSTCNAQALPVLSQTEDLAKQIDTAAKPLTGQAGQILTDVGSINQSVTSILQSVLSINGTVHSIGGLATSINGTVHSIQGSINGINSDVITIKGTGGFGPGVSDIDHRLDVALSTINAIRADTDIITTQAGQILVQAQDICHDQVRAVGILSVTGPICG
jgi:methyl-accepting chemotaxis protein